MQPLATGDFERISRDLRLDPEQVRRTLELLDQGFAVPFIARFRADVTGGLSEEQIRQIRRAAEKARALAKTKATVLKSLEARGELNEELKQRILQADDLHYVQDLHLPFRTRRDPRTQRLLEAGLGKLLEAIWTDDPAAKDLQAAAQAHVGAAEELSDVDAVLRGLRELGIRRIAQHADARAAVRRFVWEHGQLKSQLITQRSALARAYAEYKDFSAPVRTAPPYHVFQLNRGERKKALKVRVEADVTQAIPVVSRALGIGEQHSHQQLISEWIEVAIRTEILPAVAKDIRNELSERAEAHTLALVARHLRAVLLRPGIRNERILAIDPGYRTGCKCVALDEKGTPLDYLLVYPHEPLNQRDEAKQKLCEFIKRYELTLVVIGNGTGSRETEELIAEIIAGGAPGLKYTVVSEAGADAYAESQAGREEFPHEQPYYRSAVSIGRRVLDPLGELVKIVPRELCEGLDPGDFKLWKVTDYLREVVQSCVSEVGVNVNQASRWLLRYVPGLNDAVARQIIQWRNKHGAFRSRRQLLLVDAVDERRFIECAGFLRIVDGESPLDATWIHPEQYDVAGRVLELAGVGLEELFRPGTGTRIDDLLSRMRVEHLADELGVSSTTLRYIIRHLKRPYEDPRERNNRPVLKTTVLDLEQLEAGMELDGVVKRVVDFGVFVDVGARVTGLVHVSRLTTDYIEDPRELVFVGQPVRVWVVEVDLERTRLSLSLVPLEELQRRQQASRQPRRPRRPARRTGRARAAEEAQQPAAEPQQEQEVAATTAGEPRQPSRAERFRARQQKAAAARQRRQRKRPSAPVELTEEALSGKEPLRSFGELKALWEKLHSQK